MFVYRQENVRLVEGAEWLFLLLLFLLYFSHICKLSFRFRRWSLLVSIPSAKWRGLPLKWPADDDWPSNDGIFTEPYITWSYIAFPYRNISINDCRWLLQFNVLVYIYSTFLNKQQTVRSYIALCPLLETIYLKFKLYSLKYMCRLTLSPGNIKPRSI